MKIAHFSWEFPPAIWGGLGTFATEITQKQIALGNEVTVFSLNNGNKLNTTEKWNGVEVYRPKTLDLTSGYYLFANHDLRSWGPQFKFFADVIDYNVASASHLVNVLVREKGRSFDIVDAHDWLGIIGGMIAKKELDIPLVFHIHSNENGRAGGGGSTTIKDIEIAGGNTADCVITVSYAMRDELQRLGFQGDKIYVCWNGVDPSKYDPLRISVEEKKRLKKQYRIGENETVLFFIGRLVPVKGVDNLVRAMPYVLNEYPHTKLVILGVGDMEQQLVSLINELRVQEKVVLPPR